jgi:hypothetical protein
MIGRAIERGSLNLRVQRTRNYAVPEGQGITPQGRAAGIHRLNRHSALRLDHLHLRASAGPHDGLTTLSSIRSGLVTGSGVRGCPSCHHSHAHAGTLISASDARPSTRSPVAWSNARGRFYSAYSSPSGP